MTPMLPKTSENFSTTIQATTQPGQSDSNSAALQEHLKKILKLQKDFAQNKSMLEKIEKIAIPNLQKKLEN